MPAPYVLTLNPVVGIDNDITLDPSQELVLTLLPVLKGDVGSGGGSGGGSELEAGSGITITGEIISVDTSVISTKVYAETVANAALTSANAATSLVEDLAETNAFKISQLENGFDTLEQTVADNFNSLSASKADQSSLETLQDLVDTKATPADITAAIAELVGAAPESLDTLYELAAALQGEQTAIDAILTTLGNCVRSDTQQSLTTPQKEQARSNIGAELAGVAAGLIAAITPASIGAATSAQGAKADSALQSGDVAPVALSGLFSSLTGKSALFDLVYSAYVIGSNTAILASDTLGQMLGKLQAQVNAKLDANANAVSATKLNTARNINGVLFDGTADISISDSSKEPTIVAGTTAQYWRGDKTWRSFATDALDTVLTGLSTATATAVTATDTVLVGVGKLQAQITTVTTDFASKSIVNVFTKSQIVAPIINNTATSTVTPDMSASNNFQYLLTGNLTIANPTTAATNFQSGLFRLKQDGTGGRTVSFGAKFHFKTAPIFSTSANATDYVSYIYHATDDRYDCLLNAGF